MNKIKDFVVSIIIICVLLFILFGYASPKTSELYPLTARIVSLDYENDIVTCIDGTGNLWDFYECDDWQIDDFVSLLMNDNGTPEMIYDDIIEMVRYSNF